MISSSMSRPIQLIKWAELLFYVVFGLTSLYRQQTKIEEEEEEEGVFALSLKFCIKWTELHLSLV